MLLLSYNYVLQVLALGPAQRLRVVHIEQSPHLVWGLGDADGGVAGLRISRHVLIWHLEPVRHAEAIELLAVFHTDSANLGGGGKMAI